MTKPHMAARTLGTVAAGLVFTVFFAIPSYAQNDLEIMVNGPWTYVADPNPSLDNSKSRIVLVAPSDGQHVAYSWSGPDASMEHSLGATPPDNKALLLPSDSTNHVANLYYADFSGRNLVALGPPDEEPGMAYSPQKTVAKTDINNILYTPTKAQERYAISLPVPDYVRTYVGPYGKGLAESKIGVGGVARKTPPAPFTTWMILHYNVAGDPTKMAIKVTLLKASGGNLVADRSVPVETDNGRSAITFLLAETKPCLPNDSVCFNYSEQECDELSGQSFAETTGLWVLPEYARFPVQLDGMGNQDSWNYDFDYCSASHGSDVDGARTLRQQAEDRNRDILQQIEDLNGELNTLLLQQTTFVVSLNATKKKESTTLEVNKGLDTLRAEFAKDFPRGVPDEVKHALNCTSDVVKGLHPIGCPASLEQVIKEYFQVSGRFGDRDGPLADPGKGSADCHSAQMAIDGILNGLQQ